MVDPEQPGDGVGHLGGVERADERQVATGGVGEAGDDARRVGASASRTPSTRFPTSRSTPPRRRNAVRRRARRPCCRPYLVRRSRRATPPPRRAGRAPWARRPTNLDQHRRAPAGRRDSCPTPPTSSRYPRRRHGRSSAIRSVGTSASRAAARHGRAGRMTPARFAASQASLVIVKLATGTEPHASAHACRPPASRSISAAASGADSVSFHSLAGRMTSRRSSRTTIPCCCPPTLIAATVGDPAWSHADSNAAHHDAGSCSERGGWVGGWGDEPRPTTSPLSTSRTSTLVALVDESTPATRVTTTQRSGEDSCRRVTRIFPRRAIDTDLPQMEGNGST